MKIFDRYLFRHLLIATALTASVLTMVVFLTQSLQFLELVINSGASNATFWELTILAIPRFFEVILPIALMAATVFIYNRMTMDSELIVMRAVGSGPLKLAWPALLLAAGATLLLWGVSIWLAPKTEGQLDVMRDAVRSRYSSLLFHEGNFNNMKPGLTVFVRDRAANGELEGLLIYDSRKTDAPPVTVVAKRGEIADSPQGKQVFVYDGMRQQIDPQTGNLKRLDFQRYAIDMPSDNGKSAKRWRDPSERSMTELFKPNMNDPEDAKNWRLFRLEVHRRIIGPLLAPAYAVLALACLLLGPVDRRGQGWRIAMAIVGVMIVQGLYMTAFNLSRRTEAGIVMMYVFTFVPLLGGLIMLMPATERVRRAILWRGGTT